MPPIIEVENVSKRYSRNANTHLNYGLTDLLDEILRRKRTLELRTDEFWAVDRASFSLEAGASLGLVGRNGSGKTTLLKMMNGLIKPETGRITIVGHVQALINLQAGFNLNLPGRANVYNAASLLGLGRRAAAAIMEEVIAFAELEDFIDSPVNTYSSGMKARLGFSVAVNLRPDILLIDEILAVGDHAFQNKCFVKMQELKKAGTTIVLVSHSHTQIVQLCDKALWLHQGKTIERGASKEVVEAYLAFLEQEEARRQAGTRLSSVEDPASATSEDRRRAAESLYGAVYEADEAISGIEFRLFVGEEESAAVAVHGEMVLEYSFVLHREVRELNVTLNLVRKDGFLATSISTLKNNVLSNVHPGRIHCQVRVPDVNLAPGEYVITMPIHEGHSYLYRNIVKEFMVVGRGELFWGLLDLAHEYRLLDNSKIK